MFRKECHSYLYRVFLVLLLVSVGISVKAQSPVVHWEFNDGYGKVIPPSYLTAQLGPAGESQRE